LLFTHIKTGTIVCSRFLL